MAFNEAFLVYVRLARIALGMYCMLAAIFSRRDSESKRLIVVLYFLTAALCYQD